MSRRLWGVLWVLLAAHAGQAQPQLQPILDQWLAYPAMRGSSLSLAVRDARTDSLLFAYQPHTLLVPASNMKLLTTAAAWKVLGPEYRYPTTLEVRGVLADSVLRGHLSIRGSGDPSLGSSRMTGAIGAEQLLRRWAGRLREAGVHTIEGSLQVEPARFPDSPIGLTWEWSDIGSCFAQGQWPLNWRDNCLPASLEARTDGGHHLTVDTFLAPWPVLLLPMASNGRDWPLLYSDPWSPRIILGADKSVALPVALRVAMPDPPAFFRDWLLAGLQSEGFILTPGQPDTGLAPLLLSDTLYAPPLREILTAINTESRNLHAEAVLRSLGQHHRGQPTTAAGVSALRHWLSTAEPSGLPCFIHDGSGLSRHNALSAALLTRILGHIHRDSLSYLGFRETLARPGAPGTLRNALTDKKLRSRVWAKTGTLNRVRSLSGYLQTDSGQWLTFSIIVNHFDAPSPEFYALAQQMLLALLKYPAP